MDAAQHAPSSSPRTSKRSIGLADCRTRCDCAPRAAVSQLRLRRRWRGFGSHPTLLSTQATPNRRSSRGGDRPQRGGALCLVSNTAAATPWPWPDKAQRRPDARVCLGRGRTQERVQSQGAGQTNAGSGTSNCLANIAWISSPTASPIARRSRRRLRIRRRRSSRLSRAHPLLWRAGRRLASKSRLRPGGHERR